MNKKRLVVQEYYLVLKEFCDEYVGDYQEIIHDSCYLFKILSTLPNNSIIKKEDRSLILLALGYFLLSRDVYPEEIYGPKGLIDDVFLTLYCLRIIRKKYGFEILIDYWEKDYETLLKYLDKVYEELSNDPKYKKINKDVLRYCGIHR